MRAFKAYIYNGKDGELIDAMFELKSFFYNVESFILPGTLAGLSFRYLGTWAHSILGFIHYLSNKSTFCLSCSKQAHRNPYRRFLQLFRKFKFTAIVLNGEPNWKVLLPSFSKHFFHC